MLNTNFFLMGKDMYKLIERLYPICRSITGMGVRETLNIINELIPLAIHELPSNKEIFDWTVPKEWNIKAGHIKNSKGKKIIDFGKSNLHILGYSVPVNKKVSLKELKKHIFTLPEYPDAVPYITSYYKENWGFCMSHNQYEMLEEDVYEVFIDSTLTNGSLTYGEFYLKGKTEEEVLISTYICHPSLCNDNLSGIALATYLAALLKEQNLYYSYRFLFIPETIGAICWLALNEGSISKVKHGLVITCAGDSGKSTYKKSRRGNAVIDIVVEKVLKDSGQDYRMIDFFPLGSDERQFSSPAFNMPVGVLMRTPYGEFKEYHTSMDNLDFINPSSLADSLEKCVKISYILENNRTCLNLFPRCEPNLGKRNLYRTASMGFKNIKINEVAYFWILNFSDGCNSLLDIAMRAHIPFREIKIAADVLLEAGLIKILQ